MTFILRPFLLQGLCKLPIVAHSRTQAHVLVFSSFSCSLLGVWGLHHSAHAARNQLSLPTGRAVRHVCSQLLLAFVSATASAFPLSTRALDMYWTKAFTEPVK